MTTRAKIEFLRQEVGVDYAFGIAGLLTLADALDELLERVAGLEDRIDQSPAGSGEDPPSANGSTAADIVTEMIQLQKQMAKLTKAVKKTRR